MIEWAIAPHDPTGRGKIIACEPCNVTEKYDLDRFFTDISSKEEHTNLFITAANIPGLNAESDSEEASNLKGEVLV